MKLRTIAVIALLLTAAACLAQQTIMNVPSADVTDKGDVYFRADSFYQPSPALYSLNGNFSLGLAATSSST